MKKITISALLITTMLSAWEINTHRAIDQKAIEKSDNLQYRGRVNVIVLVASFCNPIYKSCIE